MSRLALIAALCAPIAGLALTVDDAASNTFEIRVPATELAECRATLAELDERPVVTDDGTWLPGFLVNDDLPDTVCVIDA
ncbi:MAG: hypothetical protein R3210_07505 [Roseovarius sp.]|nr:hypothetical protein [Roseovarius sp.]